MYMMSTTQYLLVRINLLELVNDCVRNCVVVLPLIISMVILSFPLLKFVINSKHCMNSLSKLRIRRFPRIFLISLLYIYKMVIRLITHIFVYVLLFPISRILSRRLVMVVTLIPLPHIPMGTLNNLTAFKILIHTKEWWYNNLFLTK